MSLLVRKRPNAVSISDFQESFATTPWVRLPTTRCCPVVHCGEQVFAVESAVCIAACWDGTLHWVECILAFDGASNSQPCNGFVTMGCALGSTKLSDKNWKLPHGSWHCCPAVACVGFEADFTEVTFCPVAHDIEGCVAIHNELCGILPAQCGSIAVGVGETWRSLLKRPLLQGCPNLCCRPRGHRMHQGQEMRALQFPVDAKRSIVRPMQVVFRHQTSLSASMAANQSSSDSGTATPFSSRMVGLVHKTFARGC